MPPTFKVDNRKTKVQAGELWSARAVQKSVQLRLMQKLMHKLLLLLIFSIQTSTAWAAKQSVATLQNQMKSVVAWQCLLCTEESSVFEQPGGFTLAISEVRSESEHYTRESLEILHRAKREALTAIGISNWKLNKEKLDPISEGQVAEFSGTYKNAEGETVRFKELHILSKNKSVELLFTNQVGKPWSDVAIEKTKKQTVLWLNR